MSRRGQTDPLIAAALGLALRDVRTGSGLSQAAVGRGVGMSHQAISAYETGRRTDVLCVGTLLGILGTCGWGPAAFFRHHETILRELFR